MRGTQAVRAVGPPQQDRGLAQRGYCGRIDPTWRGRCYLRREHHGDCIFSDSFQLMQQPAAAQTRDAPTILSEWALRSCRKPTNSCVP